MNTIHIYKATPQDQQRWDSFVNENNGSFFHYYRWGQIFLQKKWEFISLIAIDDNEQLLGVFPLFLIKKHFCKILKSLPEGASGGMIIKTDLTTDEKKQVADAFLTYLETSLPIAAHRIDISENLTYHDEMGNIITQSLFDHGYQKISNTESGLPSTFFLPLSTPFEEKIWKMLWNGNLRNNIRKAQREKVTVIHDENLTYEPDFLKMMRYHYIKMCTPPLSDEELHQRLHVFRDHTDLFVALYQEEPIAFLLCYATPSTMYFSKLPHNYMARKLQTNSLICYHGVKHACEKGYQYVEFGLTFNKNQARWKAKFKGKQIPIRNYQKRCSTSHCLYYDLMDHLLWNIQNKESLWHQKDKVKNRLIAMIRK